MAARGRHALTLWLLDEGEVPDRYTVTQGSCRGRAGVVSISREDGQVWVGGRATTMIRGDVRV